MSVGLGELKAYALSDADIKAMLGPVKITTYPELEGISDINQLFDAQGRAILFFPNQTPTIGHWTCLIKRPNMIEFFDPYGERPDDQKDGMTRSKMEQLDIDQPLLSRLLRSTSLPVYYNSHAFQSSRDDVATCGRHCAVRLLYKPFTIDKYAKTIKRSGLKADDFVVGVTYSKIRK
jgi:hypothetical protein